jgi:hypothetical protein
LTPGSYGKLKVKQGATLSLVAGSYRFEDVDVDKQAALELDLGGGPIVIESEKKVELGDDVVVELMGALHGRKIEVEKQATIVADPALQLIVEWLVP